MIKVRIDYSDGCYSVTEYADGHAEAGLAFVEMTEDEWLGWRMHVVQDRLWNMLLRKLDAEQYAKDHD